MDIRVYRPAANMSTGSLHPRYMILSCSLVKYDGGELCLGCDVSSEDGCLTRSVLSAINLLGGTKLSAIKDPASNSSLLPTEPFAKCTGHRQLFSSSSKKKKKEASDDSDFHRSCEENAAIAASFQWDHSGKGGGGQTMKRTPLTHRGFFSSWWWTCLTLGAGVKTTTTNQGPPP